MGMEYVCMLNCKINSTNGGTFCKSAASLFLVFFFGPGGLSYVQIGPGIQNFTKILPAYMRTRVSHCPMYAQGHQETKVIFLKNFLSSFFPTNRSKIQRFSDFSAHLYILYMCAKIRNLKVATQYFALKTLNRESYFLRKWIFLKKTK